MKANRTEPATDGRKKTLLFVGSFGGGRSEIAGGNLTACRTLMASSFSRRLEVIPLDSTMVSLPAPSLPKRIGLAAARLSAFRKHLAERNPDGVLIFASSGLSFLEKSFMARRASARGVPVVISIRDGNFMDSCRESRAFLTLARLMLRGVDRVICQGDKWRLFYGELFGFAASKCPVIPNWTVTPEHLGIPLEADRDAGSRRDPVRILFLGWVERFKGVFELMEAMRRLRGKPGAPGLELLVCGGGGALEEAKAWAAHNGLAEAVRFLGWVPPKGCLALLRDCEIFALPSRTEGLPNSMIEAMGAGRPVVVTPVGSIPDIVRDGENGILVPPGDVDRLGAALEALAADPALRSRLGSEARRTARGLFTPETAADILIGMFDQLGREIPGKTGHA